MFSRCFCAKPSARFSEEVDFKQTYLGDGGRGHRSFLCLKFQMFSHLPIWWGRERKASWEESEFTANAAMGIVDEICTALNNNHQQGDKHKHAHWNTFFYTPTCVHTHLEISTISAVNEHKQSHRTGQAVQDDWLLLLEVFNFSSNRCDCF